MKFSSDFKLANLLSRYIKDNRYKYKDNVRPASWHSFCDRTLIDKNKTLNINVEGNSTAH